MSESTTVITNQDFSMTDKRFQIACRIAGTLPLRRQASKFRRGLGVAQQAMKDFIASGYSEQKERLRADVAKLEQDLAEIKASDDADEDKIQDLEGAIKIANSDIGQLDNDLKILRGR